MLAVSLTQLVEKSAAGDQGAWDQIVDRMNNMVWSVVRSFRLPEEDAHDAAQMTWLRVLENLDNVREPERLGLWIATIARRECMRLIEVRDRMMPTDPHVSFETLTVSGDFASDVVTREQAQRILDAFPQLGDACQALLRLVLCDPPMTYREISASLAIPIGTIGARRQRCLSRLRAAVK